MKERYDIKKVASSLDGLVGSLDDFYKDIIHLERKMRSFYKLFEIEDFPPCKFLVEEGEDNLTVEDVLNEEGHCVYLLKKIGKDHPNFTVTLNDFLHAKVIIETVYKLSFKRHRGPDHKFYVSRRRSYYIKNGDDLIEVTHKTLETSLFGYTNYDESNPHKIDGIVVFPDKIMEALPSAFEKLHDIFNEKAAKYRSLTK